MLGQYGPKAELPSTTMFNHFLAAIFVELKASKQKKKKKKKKKRKKKKKKRRKKGENEEEDEALYKASCGLHPH